jgi:carboxymethylenebutenolidase
MHRTLRFLAAALLLALATAPAVAEVKTMDITFKSGDEEIKGFLAEPGGKGPFPGVVVIQEWWGLNDWIKENAKHLAAQGYVALAPDLYRGKVTDDPMVARQLLSGLPRDRAIRDLKAAADTLAARDNVRKDRLGSIGWCMGGGYSLQLALHDANIQACVICYGAVVTDAEKLEPLHATVLGIFGEEDRGIPAQGVRKFEEALKKEGKKVAGIHLYQAGHGFMRPRNGPDRKNPEYRESAARDAWQQIDKFFAQTLARK